MKSQFIALIFAGTLIASPLALTMQSVSPTEEEQDEEQYDRFFAGLLALFFLFLEVDWE